MSLVGSLQNNGKWKNRPEKTKTLVGLVCKLVNPKWILTGGYLPKITVSYSVLPWFVLCRQLLWLNLVAYNLKTFRNCIHAIGYFIWQTAPKNYKHIQGYFFLSAIPEEINLTCSVNRTGHLLQKFLWLQVIYWKLEEWCYNITSSQPECTKLWKQSKYTQFISPVTPMRTQLPSRYQKAESRSIRRLSNVILNNFLKSR